MEDYYRVPTLVLLGLLVAVFAALYARSRTQRRLLWLIGWTLVTARLAILSSISAQSVAGRVAAESSMMLAAIMFLGALSPVTFGERIQIPYVIPFSIPLLFFAISAGLDPAPVGFLHLLNFLAVVAAIVIAVDWGRRRHLLPIWFTVSWPLLIGLPCLYLSYINDNEMLLRLTHSGISIVTALLVLAAYRRMSPGVIFTASGFLLWSLPLLLDFLVSPDAPIWVPALRLLNLMKVMTAVGMIVLVLEDEARQNEAAQKRDRRARAEMEEYSKLDLSVEPHHDFGIHYNDVCQAISAASPYRQAVIFLLDVEHHLRVAASSGINAALAAALDSFAIHLPLEELERPRAKSRNLGTASIRKMDLQRWVQTGDEMELQNFTDVSVIPIAARTGALQGILMLAALKDEESLLPEDLLPLELLVARVAAARENGLLLRRVTRSEKLAGIGQLAGGVAHELNNPLTVVMGYAELIQEISSEERIRRDASIIRNESHRMKQIIESLARFWKPSPSPVSSIAVPELLAEVESMRRGEYERRKIRFDVVFSAELPRIHANSDQMRQVLLQILDNASSSTDETQADREKKIRLEATRTDDRLQIVISNSGPGFPNPDKIFDPFFTVKQPGEAPGLALSLCYSIIREQGGDMSASNLHPCGAAVIVDLPIERSQNSLEPSSSPLNA
jgi:two-component system NtrC family sensor kinase